MLRVKDEVTIFVLDEIDTLDIAKHKHDCDFLTDTWKPETLEQCIKSARSTKTNRIKRTKTKNYWPRILYSAKITLKN